MLAAVFLGDGRLELKKRPIPCVKNRDDVLLRVEATSICGSDLHILDVPPTHPAEIGIIQGHEYAGEVLEVGQDVSHLNCGDRVIVSPDIRCGHCYYCQIGLTSMCENKTTLGEFADGGFAQYNVAPAQALFRVSKSVPPEIAAVGEPLACAMSGITKLNIQPGDAVMVLGAGPLGVLFALLAKMCGAGKVIVSEIMEGRRAYARSLGIDVVVDPSQQDPRRLSENGYFPQSLRQAQIFL